MWICAGFERNAGRIQHNSRVAKMFPEDARYHRPDSDAERRLYPVFAGLPDDKELYVPLYIFDKSNAASAGIPATYDQGYGNEHVAGYEKLWELK